MTINNTFLSDTTIVYIYLIRTLDVPAVLWQSSRIKKRYLKPR